MKNKIIIILGPTASGKTEWGIKLAQKFKGEIISADSRTVYKYFNIGTAKPAKKEMQGIKHYLLDFVDPKKKVYTVYDFQKDAQIIIKDILKRNKLPIIVGGSALFIYSLTRGYKFNGKGDNKLRRELEGKSLSQLQAMVKRIKNISLNTSDFQNKRRLIRAIEVNTNYKLEIVPMRVAIRDPDLANASVGKNCRQSPLPYSFLKIGIKSPRKEIYKRIDKRTANWMKNDSIIKEVNALLKNKVSKNRIIEFGLGYREILKYLDGELKTKKELVERINFSQHAFVRRQMTWFRKDREINWCEKITEAEKLVNKFIK